MMILELTEQELQALCGLLDAGVRQTGLRGVKDAAALIKKIEEACTVASKSTSSIQNAPGI